MAPTVLSPRLAAVASCVPAGRAVADIGTDHALLPAFLVATGRVPRAIAIDVAEGPLQAAAVTTAGVDGVELRRGDGLHPLRAGEVGTIVIAGMGGLRIQQIVDAGLPDGVTDLVLQPNTHWAETRGWIASRRLRLVDEVMACDRDKFYVVLSVSVSERVAAPGWDDSDLELGPRLRHRRDDVWQRWVAHQHARMQAALRASAGAADLQRDRLERRAAIFAAAR